MSTVDTLLLATNPRLFYSPTNETSQSTSLGQNRTIDYLFSGIVLLITYVEYVHTDTSLGNYWNCHRQIMELDPSSLRGYVGHVYGKGWEVRMEYYNIYAAGLSHTFFVLTAITREWNLEAHLTRAGTVRIASIGILVT